MVGLLFQDGSKLRGLPGVLVRRNAAVAKAAAAAPGAGAAAAVGAPAAVAAAAVGAPAAEAAAESADDGAADDEAADAAQVPPAPQVSVRRSLLNACSLLQGVSTAIGEQQPYEEIGTMVSELSDALSSIADFLCEFFTCF